MKGNEKRKKKKNLPLLEESKLSEPKYAHWLLYILNFPTEKFFLSVKEKCKFVQETRNN